MKEKKNHCTEETTVEICLGEYQIPTTASLCFPACLFISLVSISFVQSELLTFPVPRCLRGLIILWYVNFPETHGVSPAGQYL